MEQIRRQQTHYGYFHTELFGMWPEWGPLQEPQEEYLARKRLMDKEELFALEKHAANLGPEIRMLAARARAYLFPN